jgi:tetratricopeptide (TPR) repeat protein
VDYNAGQITNVSGTGPVHAPHQIGRDYNVYGVAPPTAVSWPVRVGTVPQLADGFQLRSVPQAELDENLVAGSTAVLTQILTGLGGNGKTQLAAALARNLWDARRLDCLAWVTASSRAAIVTGYAQIARAVGLAVDPTDAEQGASAFLGWAETTQKQWLLVLDDLGDPADLAGLWPTGSAGRVLVTTRRHDGALAERNRQVINVGLFTPHEALAYFTTKLQGRAKPSDVVEEAAELAADLGLLPLALAQAAAVINEQGLTCAQYRVRFGDQRQHLVNLLPPDALADDYATGPHAHHRATIATTWAISIEAANALPPEGLAMPLLHLAAHLDPNGIPVDLFTAFGNRLSSDEAQAEADRAEVDREAPNGDMMRQGLGNLARLGLVELDAPATRAAIVRVHALVQRAVRDSLNEATKRVVCERAADILVEAWPADDYLPAQTALASRLRANATALIRNAVGTLWRQAGTHPILFRTGRSLTAAGLTDQAVEFWSALTADISTALGSEHSNTLSSRNNLASAYRAAGRLAEAVPLYEATLALSERVLGAEHPSTLTSRNNLASAYHAAGKVAEAVPLLEATLAACERVLGAEHPTTLSNRNNLASAYRAAGRVAEAVPLLEATLAACERVFGAEHPNTLTSSNNLASAYRAAGRLAEALPLQEVTLAVRERVLGTEHPDTLTSRNNLASAYQVAGRLAEAVLLYEATLAARERVLGAEHPNTLISRSNLASAYQAAEETSEATA